MSLTYNPKVSIVIPVYNGANFLREAVDSALSQTYKNIEIIVVNDGSNDNGETERIALSYGDKIKYYCKENGGVSSALNLGIKMMTGEYFSWLSHDDLYTEEKINNSVKLLNQITVDRSKLIIHTDGRLVKEDKTELMPFHKYFKPGKVYTGTEAANVLACKGTLCGCCLLIPRKAFDEVGFFNESLRYSQDSLMWFLLFLNGYQICSTGIKDVLSRVHKKQVTLTRKDLFYHDSLLVAKILAPKMCEKTDAKYLYFNYTKRRMQHNCTEAFRFLIDYAKENGVFTKWDIMKLKYEQIKGTFVFNVKKRLKKIILKT